MTDAGVVDDSERCPRTKHVDGKSHGWRFWGDDPYIICVGLAPRRSIRSRPTARTDIHIHRRTCTRPHKTVVGNAESANETDIFGGT